MPKKCVSAEEKRVRMMALFYEKGECFQLKELEKVAPAEKGILANSVKEVIQQLVDEGLVDTDKIGMSVYYWAFPSKAKHSRKRKLEELQSKFDESNKKLKLMEKCVEKTESTEDEDEKYRKILEEINDLEIELHNLKKTLKDLQENDPAKFQEMAKKAEELKTAANRWTDNIFQVKSWCNRKFNVEESTMNKQFGIPEDLDYV